MPERRVWTAGEVLAAAERVAVERGGGPTRADLLRLLADTLGVERLELLLDHDRPLTDDERSRFRGRFARLLAGEPYAYVVGHAEFYGRRFRVDPRVLIPRPETEDLVGVALERLERGSSVFEPGTGSGCIACTLALERDDLEVVASDVDPGALEVARENARLLGARVRFCAGSWWEPVAGRRFDALVANPPYVDPKRPDLLDPSVRRYEPAVALFADPPLSAYVALLRGGVEGLRPGALVVLECGIDTAEALRALVERSRNYGQVALLPDSAGRPRILVCRRR